MVRDAFIGAMRALMPFAIVAALCTNAAADDKTGEARSRELFTRGAELYDAGNRDEALRLFEQSYALVARAKTLLNIGVILSELGRDVEAANALARYVADPDADRARISRVEELLASLDAKVLRLDLDLAGFGAIAVDRKTLTDKQQLRTVLRVAAGVHVVSVGDRRKTVEGDAGETVRVVIADRSAAPETRDPAAPLEAPRKEAPPEKEAPPLARVRASEGGPSIASHPALWTGALTLVAAGVGTGYALAFRSTQNELDSVNANSGGFPFSKASELKDTASRRALLANIALGVAGAGALTTIVLIVVIDRPGAGGGESMTLAPVIDADGAGLTVSGRF